MLSINYLCGFFLECCWIEDGLFSGKIYRKLSIPLDFIGEAIHVTPYFSMICMYVGTLSYGRLFCIIPGHNRRGFGVKDFMKLQFLCEHEIELKLNVQCYVLNTK